MSLSARRFKLHQLLILPCLGAVLSLAACGNDFKSGVLVETAPCAENVGPWNGLNDFKTRNNDGSLTVYKCHYTQAVADDAACPEVGDPLCESNWISIDIGSPASTVRRFLGEPIKVSGVRWQYPNNNSVSVDEGVVVNIFKRSASLYSNPPL